MLKMKSCRFLLLTAAALFFTTAAADSLRIGNASNSAPLRSLNYHALKLGIEDGHNVSFKHLDPEQAINALQKNEVDLLILDKRFLRGIPDGFKSLPYAAEALCLYVHSHNPAGSLTPGQIKQILTGAEPKWNSFSPLAGAADIQRITLRQENPGAQLISRVFGNTALNGKYLRVSSMMQIFNFVNNPAAVGFAPYASEYPADIAVLPVNDIAPSTANLKSGAYPLTLHYVIICPVQTPPLMKQWLNAVFALDERRKLPEYGLIPLWEVER